MNIKEFMHKIKYYLVLKEKGILSCATPLINHDDLVPSEMSQYRMTYYMIPSI